MNNSLKSKNVLTFALSVIAGIFKIFRWVPQDFSNLNLSTTGIMILNILRRGKAEDELSQLEYWVTPLGEDKDDCFKNCKTITYVIQNQCQQEKHLMIHQHG